MKQTIARDSLRDPLTAHGRGHVWKGKDFENDSFRSVEIAIFDGFDDGS